MATASGCGVSQQEYVAKESEAQKYKQALHAESSKTAALEQKNADLDAKLNALQKQLDELGARAQTASAQKSQLEAKTARLQAETGQLKGQQAAMLNAQMLFPENSSKLTTEAKHSLDSIADAIRDVKDKAVVVAAYTDDTEGTGATKRWQLSSARATEVAKYLIGRGLDPKMIGVAGFGEGRPVAPNDSLANRALNRRAEVVLTQAGMAMKTIDVNPATLQK
jgi:chemotaxis protein MotB